MLLIDYYRVCFRFVVFSKFRLKGITVLGLTMDGFSYFKRRSYAIHIDIRIFKLCFFYELRVLCSAILKTTNIEATSGNLQNPTSKLRISVCKVNSKYIFYKSILYSINIFFARFHT
jgi:predicted methyltransferase